MCQLVNLDKPEEVNRKQPDFIYALLRTSYPEAGA
jgi:hypothetical protein